jgi:hypothetical protein
MRSRTALLLWIIFAAVLPCYGRGFRTSIGPDAVPLVVVAGDSYEMGRSLGTLIPDEMQKLISATVGSLGRSGDSRYSAENLDAAWKSVSPHISRTWKRQLRGLADGSGIPLRQLMRAHMIPVVGDYSCSGAAIWGDATEDGKMYVFRNLDYSLRMRMQELPVVVVYLPDDGLAHVNPTFAGFIGVQTGMNERGLALTEMGDSPGRDYPFDLDGVPFFTLFSDLLYRAEGLDAALGTIRQARRIKKYHYVIGCGADRRGVKIRAHAPDLAIWTDNDPDDESAPNVFRHVVINAESRAPVAFEHIRANYGKYNAQKVIELTKAVPIKGGNLFAVVYDATDLRMYFAYARDDQEAYKRPLQTLDLKVCFDYASALKTFTIEKTAPANPQ